MREKNIEGVKYGRLLILKRAPNRGKRRTCWYSKCDCGNDFIVALDNLRSGDTKSCGCYRKEVAGNLKRNPNPKPKKEKIIKTEDDLLREAKERFWNKVEKQNSCWIWKGPIAKNYGMMFYKGQIKAHRFSYLIHHGELKKKYFICHHCDNPLCVNPDHIYQGKPKENSRDAQKRKRMRMGDRHHKTKIKDEDVKYIRSCSEKGVDLAKKYNVNKTTISGIRTYRMRKYVSN